jgi:hypothetical protein
MLAIPSAAVAADTPSSNVPAQKTSGSSQCYLSPESEHSFNCDEIDEIKAEVDKAADEKNDNDSEDILWLVIIVLLCLVFCT